MQRTRVGDGRLVGRIAAFRIIVEQLGRGVSLRPRLINPQLFKEAKRILDLSAADIRRAAKEADRKIRSKHSPGIDRPV
jgi:hypothetical protein